MSLILPLVCSSTQSLMVRRAASACGQEIEPFLPPQGVGDAQLASLGSAGPLDLVLQRGDGAVQLRLLCRQVKHARHLRGGISPRSRVRHRQCGGDAVGGEEDVPLLSFQPVVELQGESIAGLRDGVLLLHGHPRGELLDGPCRAARQHDCRDSRRNSRLHSHSPLSLPGARGNGPHPNLWPAAPAVNTPDARRQALERGGCPPRRKPGKPMRDVRYPGFRGREGGLPQPASHVCDTARGSRRHNQGR